MTGMRQHFSLTGNKGVFSLQVLGVLVTALNIGALRDEGERKGQ
jgi:hypothetical protein